MAYHNDNGYKISKNEIKKDIQEELQCDYGFIKYLTKVGEIQRIQDAYADPIDSDEIVREVMNEVFDLYKDYCNAWNMDYEADNRCNKEYLGRDARKRIVIPQLRAL